MAEEVIINRPAPFVEDIGKKLSEQALALQGVPVVTTSASGLTKAPGETDAGFLARQQAAQAFDVRKQNLAGIAPQVAGQDVLQQQAQALAQQNIANQLQLGGAQQGFLGQDVGALSTLGAQNQALAQAQLSANQQLAQAQLQQPLQAAQALGAGITGLIAGYPGQTQQQISPSPSLAQTALGTGATLAGIYRGFGLGD